MDGAWISVQEKLFPEIAVGVYRNLIESEKYLQPGYMDAFDEETMKVSIAYLSLISL